MEDTDVSTYRRKLSRLLGPLGELEAADTQAIVDLVVTIEKLVVYRSKGNVLYDAKEFLFEELLIRAAEGDVVAVSYVTATSGS